MPDYNPSSYSPGFGGVIDSLGNIKNFADTIENGKVKVEISTPPQMIYVQGTPALTWTIDHKLERYPQVTTLDSTGAQISGTVTWPTLNRVVITFFPAVAGRAFLT